MSDNIGKKVEHVKSQTQTRDHHCHWPGCKKQVPPAMWGCSKHWFMIPPHLRSKIWRTYRPGQERTFDPSREYVMAAREVQEWIKTKYSSKSTVDTSVQE